MEMIACREALCLAEDLQVNQFVVASYSKQVVQDINQGTLCNYAAITNEVRARALSFSCKFIFEGRANNYEAHSLARFSLNLALGRHVWLDQPHDTTCIPPSVDLDE